MYFVFVINKLYSGFRRAPTSSSLYTSSILTYVPYFFLKSDLTLKHFSFLFGDLRQAHPFVQRLALTTCTTYYVCKDVRYLSNTRVTCVPITVCSAAQAHEHNWSRFYDKTERWQNKTEHWQNATLAKQDTDKNRTLTKDNTDKTELWRKFYKSKEKKNIPT